MRFFTIVRNPTPHTPPLYAMDRYMVDARAYRMQCLYSALLSVVGTLDQQEGVRNAESLNNRIMQVIYVCDEHPDDSKQLLQALGDLQDCVDEVAQLIAALKGMAEESL